MSKYESPHFLEHVFNDGSKLFVVRDGDTYQVLIQVSSGIFDDNMPLAPVPLAVTGPVDYERTKVAFSKAVIEDDPDELVKDMFNSGFEDTSNDSQA